MNTHLTPDELRRAAHVLRALIYGKRNCIVPKYVEVYRPLRRKTEHIPPADSADPDPVCGTILKAEVRSYRDKNGFLGYTVHPDD